MKNDNFTTLVVLFLLYLAITGGKVGPVVPPAPAGPFTIFVPIEEGSMTTEFADTRTDLQAGPTGKPFLDKGHRFLFIDNDTDSSVVKRFAPYKDDVPEVIVFKGEKLLHRFPTTYKTSAEELAATLQGKGL